jgi:HK97 family phage major capsid protein
MSKVATLERALSAKGKEGLSLLTVTMETCEKANREMTAEERAAIDTISADCKALQAKIERVRGDETLARELDALSQGIAQSAAAATARLLPPAAGVPARRMSLGEQFARSEQYQYFATHQHRTSSAWRSPTVEIFDPRWATTLTEDPASGGSLVIPQYLPGIVPFPTPPIVVADLFSQGTTTSNAIVYMKETAFTNTAAAVAEGAAKPESALVFASVTDPVRKIAHWLPVSEEMLEDVAQITSYINARLSLGVQLAEDNQLLNGDGVAPDLVGVLNRPGLAASHALTAPENNADAMLKQTMAIFASSYVMPDGYVMNPANWTSTILLKTTQGQYLVAGPFSPIQRPTLWGLPVAVSPSMAAGTGLVGSFKMSAQIFRNGGMRVEASNSHQDFFIKNLVAIRAEERLALCVYRPGAFGTVTGLT